MSLVFNMVGGGSGGGLTDGSALLSVTVPTGSTVTAIKSGTTLQPSLWLLGADASTEVALFVFTPAQFDSINPCTITATDGTSTASTTVLITTNKEYEIQLAYKWYLHKVGVGLADGYSWETRSGYTVNVTSESIWIPGDQGNNGFVVTPAIDLTNYSICVFEYIKNNAGYSDNNAGRFGFASGTNVTSTNSAEFVFSVKPAVATDWTQATIDISSAEGAYYFKFWSWNNQGEGVRNVYLQ